MTGTFDNWSKSEKMAKVGNTFEKSVEMPDTSERIYYKVCVTLHLSLNHLRLSASAPRGFQQSGPAPRSPCVISTKPPMKAPETADK